MAGDDTALEDEDSVEMTKARFSGDLAEITIFDLFETLLKTSKEGFVKLETDVGNGTLWFFGGTIVDAEIGEAYGEPAVYRLLMCSRGSFDVKFKHEERPITIDLPIKRVVMEGLRRLDDWQLHAKNIPSPGTVMEVHDERRMAWEDALEPEDLDLLEMFDGRLTLLDIVEQYGTDPATALASISRLAGRGLLRSTEQQPRERTWKELQAKRTVEDFWTREFRRHATEHRHPTNFALHIVGVLLMLFTLVAAVVTLDWRMLLGGQLVGWALQASGHAIEGNDRELFKPRHWYVLSTILVLADIATRVGIPLAFAQRAREALRERARG